MPCSAALHLSDGLTPIFAALALERAPRGVHVVQPKCSLLALFYPTLQVCTDGDPLHPGAAAGQASQRPALLPLRIKGQ